MMQISLTPEQEQFLEKQLKSGKYNTPQDVINKAFQLLEEDDIQSPSDLKVTEADEVEKQINLGREFMNEYHETFQELAK
jgi:putative addiction module CopG family antidote